MNIKTYRAPSLRDALDLVRSDLGPDAAVLHTREVGHGLLGRLLGRRAFEVSASANVNVPSRLPERLQGSIDESPPARLISTQADQLLSSTSSGGSIASYDSETPVERHDGMTSHVQIQLETLTALVEGLRTRSDSARVGDLPEALFHVYTNLIEADIDEDTARELVDQVRKDSRPDDLVDPLLVMSRVATVLEDQITVAGPINTSTETCRVVALVGPTGVGKTTTIAKLAANYRLREKKRVGLITVDTYRIAAVEQLRTYADIIDLPMEVVATPREMREAVARLAHLDLVLLDTAGRSPRDEVKIQELKSMLGEAKADEVHLVLSSTAAAKSLASTAERFQEVGTTAILLTKLDEASCLGNLLELARQSPFPLSYLTDGQNVPDDIQVAQPRNLAQMILGMEV